MEENSALQELESETVETESTEKKVDEGKPAEEPKAKPKENRYSKRVKELNSKWRESERKVADLERKLGEREEAEKIKKEPDPEDYDDMESYRKDRKKWNDQEYSKIRKEERNSIKEKSAGKKQKEAFEKGKNAYLKSRPSYVKEDPDFHKYEVEIDEAVEQWQAPEIQNIILKSKELGCEIVKHFGNNPDDLLDIVSSSPSERIFKMGRLTAKLQAKPVKKSSSAPDPVRSEKGSAKKISMDAKDPYDPKRESFSEFARRRNGL